MTKFSKRFKRLLDFADEPLPGDRVRIGQGARNKDTRGVVGVVRHVASYVVEIDGGITRVTPQNLKVVDDD